MRTQHLCRTVIVLILTATAWLPGISRAPAAGAMASIVPTSLDQGARQVGLHGLQQPGTKNHQGVTHRFMAGAKVGALFAFGLELDYILKNSRRKILYLGAAAQTSIVLNAINGGGGVFITNWGLGIGARYNHVFRLYNEDISIGIPGYSPEVVWYKEMGPNKNWYINLRAATIITKEDFWPDISFGIFLPLNR